MNQLKDITRTAFLLLAILAVGCSQPKQTQVDRSDSDAPMGKQPGGNQSLSGDQIAERLDSLAEISSGDYIHLYIGPCFGKCDGYVSIYRESPAKYHIYEAEGWKYDEQTREFILHRIRRPVGSDDADAIIQKAKSAGILRLVNDTTYHVTDQSHFWLRARIDDNVIDIDNAYVGGEKYAVEQGGERLSTTYQNVRTALLSYLFSR